MPSGTNDALARAQQSLLGLRIGDAFGEGFFVPAQEFREAVASRCRPDVPWFYTDDTEMSLSVVALLSRRGELDQDELIALFARHFDLSRGYGPSMQRALRQIQEGEAWQTVIGQAFEGQGSYGNGAAMRAGPIGAYFADNLARVVEQARCASLVTHRHPEAVAGAVAVAVAAAHAWTLSQTRQPTSPVKFLEFVLPHVPDSEVQSKLRRAARLPRTTTPELAASILGNGERLSAQDTVPFCLWAAAHFPDDYEEALWATVSAGGDRDTTCAIVGSIVALRAVDSIPAAWSAVTEALPEWFTALIQPSFS